MVFRGGNNNRQFSSKGLFEVSIIIIVVVWRCNIAIVTFSRCSNNKTKISLLEVFVIIKGGDKIIIRSFYC